MQFLRAQGATEYLVLLAVVLIVALVSVALLGFFPGMASDAQLTQSKAYWASAQPLSLTEIGLAYKYFSSDSDKAMVLPYIKIRNSGVYPIRLVKLLGGKNIGMSYPYSGAASQYLWYGTGVWYNLTEVYIGPGEETCIGCGWASTNHVGLTYTDFCPQHSIYPIQPEDVPNAFGYTGGCSFSSPGGTLTINNFGFEYIEYLDNGQQITKRQIGKELVIKCREPS